MVPDEPISDGRIRCPGCGAADLFSDAVVAIAITLLAIELPAPAGDTFSKFWPSVRHDDGHYAAFLISFAVIAAAWRDHHDLFRYAGAPTRG